MDLTFSEMSVDTSLAQKYLKNNKELLELYNNYDETINQNGQYFYNARDFSNYAKTSKVQIDGRTLLNMASLLKENATLIMQLEYHTRNIPLEDTNAQLSLLIQYLKYLSQFSKFTEFVSQGDKSLLGILNVFDPLLKFGSEMCWLRSAPIQFKCLSRETAAISHLLVTLLHKAGYRNVVLEFEEPPYENSFKKCPVEGWDSGTVAVVSEDADVDSAVDKFISISKQVPWRLRRILVQESVYQTFKDALNWKCNLKKSSSNTLTSNVLCSDTLTYNDKTFLIDPVEPSEENNWSIVTVEAYRTTKEMIDLVQQQKPYYLSLWTNGIAQINEVTHRTEAPVMWVNNLADFRGPLEVSAAVLAGDEAIWIIPYKRIEKCAKVEKLCELSQSWLKLDFEARRDILCGVLDKYIAFEKTNKIYTELKKSISECTLNSFVDVGKDYVCIGTLQPRGVIATKYEGNIFSIEHFKSILLGNALIVYEPDGPEHHEDVAALEDAGVPVVYVKDFDYGDFLVFDSNCVIPSRMRVSWTNSGTIFAN